MRYIDNIEYTNRPKMKRKKISEKVKLNFFHLFLAWLYNNGNNDNRGEVVKKTH